MVSEDINRLFAVRNSNAIEEHLTGTGVRMKSKVDFYKFRAFGPKFKNSLRLYTNIF